MAPEPPPESAWGVEAEATLWGLVTRLRARGWRISLWEVQRAQDVVAYLVARLGRPPTDDELERHLRPILCARDSELPVFAEAFRDSIAAAAPVADVAVASVRRRRRFWLILAAAAAALAFVIAVLSLVSPTGGAGDGGGNSQDGNAGGQSSVWATLRWASLIVLCAISAIGLMWFSLRKRLTRRPGSRDPGHDLELAWATAHPLETLECVRIARSLRAKAAEPGCVLDVRRTVDASIRAGLRLTPHFVQRKHTPEYLAVIEQRSARDVLAAYHAKVVDQVSAQGVAMRRVGIQPRSQLVIDPVRGRRRLEALQPASERERLLLFSHDSVLRDPLSGDARPWLSRFDRWAETIQIAPDVDEDRPLRVVDRVLSDVRGLDPVRAGGALFSQSPVVRTLPAVLETGDELWVEPCPPPNDELTRALDLLVTALGPSGWYWLSACALYPEMSYELTVSLGRLLRGDDGEPVTTHVDIAVLARLPWYRHAYMPDWLRATLISTMSHGQLIEARAALDQVLISGLLRSTDEAGNSAVAESRAGTGRRTGDTSPAGPAEISQDRVYLDGSALRRRRLVAAAPRELVAALRRHRRRLATATLPGDAPSLRVRRALVWTNGVLVVAALVTSVALAVLATDAAVAGDLSALYDTLDQDSSWALIIIVGTFISCVPATIAFVFSLLAGRLRGVVIGASTLVFLGAWLAFLLIADATEQSGSFDILVVGFLVVRLLTLACIVAALLFPVPATIVAWVSFRTRIHTAFLVSVGMISVLILTWSLATADVLSLGTRIGGLGQIWEGLIQISAVLGLCGAGSVALAAAYFGGVRIIPLTAGGVSMVCGAGYTIANDLGLALLFGLPGLLVLGGFYWQLQRVREWPPLDFWETEWREWKWPLAFAATATTAALTLYFSRDWEVVLWLSAFPVTYALLSLAADLLADRLAVVVARHRPSLRLHLHLD